LPSPSEARARQEPSKTLKLNIGGVYLKKSEPIFSIIGSAGGIPPEPPFRPPRQKAGAERQTAKESEKMSARTLFWSEAGFSLFLIKFILFDSIKMKAITLLTTILSKL